MTTLNPQYPLVQLVSAPDPGADVRFDANDGTAWVHGNGYSLGAPPLLGPAGARGAKYDYRTLTFPLTVRAGEQAALAKQAQLARELLRDENYLMFKLSPTTPPVWFKVLRSSPVEMSMARVYNDRETNNWVLSIVLTAEPFFMGEKRSASFTVANDPAVTDGLAVTLPDIGGDAPAPLTIEIPGDPDGSNTAYSLLTVLPVDGPWPGVQVFQAEAGALATDASVESSTAASGGSRVSVDFDLAETMEQRVSVTWAPPFAGRYKVFARVSAVACSATVQGNSSFTEQVKTTLVAGESRVVELGTFAFPFGNMPTARPYTLDSRPVTLEGKRESGSGTLKIDYFLFIPFDVPLDQVDRATLLQWDLDGAGAPSTQLDRVIDGENYRSMLLFDGDYFNGSTRAWTTQPVGRFPVAHPDATNVLHFLPRERAGLTWVDLVAKSTPLTVSWRPRYLWMIGPS